MPNYISAFRIRPNTQTYQELIPASKRAKTPNAIISSLLFLVLFHLVNVDKMQTCAKNENVSLWLGSELFSNNVCCNWVIREAG
jgi:hypothetical protein